MNDKDSEEVARKQRVQEMFSKKAFDVEHALNMYALSFVTMPAFGIYEKEVLEYFEEKIKTCHIYLVGIVPKIDLRNVTQEGSTLITSLEYRDELRHLRWPMPDNASLACGDEGDWYVIDSHGRRSFPSREAIVARLKHEFGGYDFEILYIGQAFGEDGSRSALDRLKKHETLQKISLQGIPQGYVLTLLMLEIVPATRMITMFNPFAMDNKGGEDRIDAGLEKLFNTTDAERTTLYEASLIRYFQPKYNKEFKNSFPSTNMKILSDCYDKDIAAVVAEISFDEMPFQLFSPSVKPKADHMAYHDLHTDEARRVFFTPLP